MADARRPYVAGNWKMHKTASEARAYVEALLALIGREEGAVDVVVCAPFTALAVACEAAAGSRLRVAAQTMNQADAGPFTGEVSAPMLVELGVDAVVLGHSECRLLFGETDRALSEKVPAALAAGLEPILCVGETEQEREAGDMERRLRQQVTEALDRVPPDQVRQVVVAYEPVWAIGTGRNATAEQAQEAITFVRALIAARSPDGAAAARILYGGSVNPDNAAEIMAQPDVDGALVGGASLDPESFAAIVGAASP